MSQDTPTPSVDAAASASPVANASAPAAPPPATHAPRSPADAPSTLEWVTVGMFGVVLLTIFFPWVSIFVEFLGDGRFLSAPMAISHVPFFAFLTLVGAAAVIAGTLLKGRNLWFGVARLPAAALVVLAMLIGLIVGISYPATEGDPMGAAAMVGEVTAVPSGLWILGFLLALGGTGVLLVAALKSGFAEIRTALASRRPAAV